MGERLLCKQEVIGSIPFTSTGQPLRGAGQRRRRFSRGLAEAERRPGGVVAGCAGARRRRHSAYDGFACGRAGRRVLPGGSWAGLIETGEASLRM